MTLEPGNQPTPQYSPHPMYPAVYAVKPPYLGLTIASFIASCIGFLTAALYVIALPASIAGIVMGHIAIRQLARSLQPRSGKGFALAGLIVGYVALAIAILWALFWAGLSSAFSTSD